MSEHRDHKAIAAERVRHLAAHDPFVRALGMHCTEAGPGHASVTLAVEKRHLNFMGTCHGGVTFALADTAFGLASNSHGQIAAGIDAHITYHVAAQVGDMLTARAVEVSRTRKLAVYRVEITRADATLVASFTGTVYISARAHASAAGHG